MTTLPVKKDFSIVSGELKFSLNKAMYMTNVEWKEYMKWIKIKK